MSLTQRLAWLDGVSTVAVLAAAIAMWSPTIDDPATSLWRLAARAGIVAVVCLGAFYYNDLYDFAKRAPFSERVLIMGGGRLAADLAGQILTRPDLAMRVTGVLTADGDAVASARRLGGYGDVADVVLRERPDRIIVAMPDRRG